MVTDNNHNSSEQPSPETTQNSSQQEQSSAQGQNAQHELDRYKEQLVRVSADLQNYKKRVEKERAEWAITAQANLLMVILPILGDLDNAVTMTTVEAAEHDKHGWLDGFKLIHKKMIKTLNDLGVQEIDCSKDFDPHFHEALMQVDSTTQASGAIVQVLAKGYLYKGEVIKHAKVSVAR